MVASDVISGSGGGGGGGALAVLDQMVSQELKAGGLMLWTLAATPNQVTSSAHLDLPVPAGAIIATAAFEVIVDPPQLARIGDVASVRAVNPGPDGTASEFVVDFKTLQTVSEVATGLLGARLSGLHAWLGTEFDSGQPAMAMSVDGTVARFTEIQTERLRLLLQSNVTPAMVEQYSVKLPSSPAAVEILINGVRAWFAPIGASSPQSVVGRTTRHSFADVVDLTRPLQLALDADGAVEVELRTTSPAQLSFATAPLEFFRSHQVSFADGPTRTFEAAVEGLYPIELPLPSAPTTGAWRIHAVELSLRADIGDVRVQPASGPLLATDAELILGDARTLLVKLPADSVGRFGTITGVRLPVRAGSGGGELTGELLADDATTVPSRPGTPLANGALAAANVPAATTVDYLSLSLTKPYKPPPDSGALWVAVTATRGAITWALSASAAASPGAEREVRWRAPSGSARPLSQFGPPGESDGPTGHTGAVRIVGTSDRNRPIDAVSIQIEGRETVESLTPFETGTAVRLELVDPVTPAEHRAEGPPWILRCLFSVAGPGTYTIATARLIYVDPALDAAFEPGGTP